MTSEQEVEAVVRASFARQGLMGHLGAELTSVGPGEVAVEVGHRDELTQQHGFFHAAVTTALVDTACGYAALTLMPAGSEVLSVEFKVNLLAPARGQRLVGRARVVRSGRTITVCQGDAYAVDHGVETPPAGTRHEVAVTVGGPRPLVLARVADRAAFSPEPAAEEDADRVWTAVLDMRHALGRGLTRWQRLRAAVSTRSLRRYHGPTRPRR